MAEKKTKGKLLEESLLINNENASMTMSDADISKADKFCEGYKEFLNTCKTERECNEYAIAKAEKAGFKPFDYTKEYKAGDKIYLNNRGKALILAVIGTQGLDKGVHIMASHIDAPRLDLKPRPLYEQSQLAMMKTHYYGGIKKYQWTALPLSMHGVVVKADGEQVKVSIGEGENDPVFCVTDLLPHLAQDQMKRTASEAIKGEELNLLVGSRMYKDKEISEKVKLNIMKILNDKYGFVEKDMLSAELEVVPAIKASDVGFDRSMIGAYGHDDRVCAYTSLVATLECKKPSKTVITVLADKEEIGSEGNTGLKCAYLSYFIADLAKPYGIEARTVLSNSDCLSADVNAAYDPTFGDVHEQKNSCYLNYGTVVTKYTGARGKSGSNDASAEFSSAVARLFDKNNVIWQTGELGKVDQGGGGTVAAYVANLNVDVIDLGVPVMSMHSPFEIVSKLDVYMTYKAFDCYCNW